MKKKAYIAAPMVHVEKINLNNMIAASATVDGLEGLTYDPTEGNASGGLSRRRNNLWDDEDFTDEEF